MADPKADNDNKVVSQNDRTRSIEYGRAMKSASSRQCPICEKQTVHDYRPFCSKRCADVDLGKWLDGQYAIAGYADAEEDGNPPPEHHNSDKKVEESE